MAHADVIHELTELWNSGDVDSVFELYTEDAEIRTGPHWPEQATYRGLDAIRATSEEWASLWETLQIEVDELEEYGDKLRRDRRVADARRGERRRRRDADLHRVHLQGWEDRSP